MSNPCAPGAAGEGRREEWEPVLHLRHRHGGPGLRVPALLPSLYGGPAEGAGETRDMKSLCIGLRCMCTQRSSRDDHAQNDRARVRSMRARRHALLMCSVKHAFRRELAVSARLRLLVAVTVYCTSRAQCCLCGLCTNLHIDSWWLCKDVIQRQLQAAISSRLTARSHNEDIVTRTDACRLVCPCRRSTRRQNLNRAEVTSACCAFTRRLRVCRLRRMTHECDQPRWPCWAAPQQHAQSGLQTASSGSLPGCE